ncbi:DUF2637 domain-containing protein [Nonomuraea basaltis]|uniref:DUF2637 domain-containing protein n=1 Tax=Nonomuraea basaltis TaxID=2495887 RepID=UPI00110C69C4|nr:DUF2637 domain-containing protein [Nonomuraea basaltis]TMR92326.1 DUF2637 domain-containing protein [Nonomuraea basaltis]
MTRHSVERRIKVITMASVLLVALVAAVVSFRHMHELARWHGEDALAAALIPLSVDGTIVAASMSLLSSSRYGRRGGVIPWTLLVVSSLASLGANVAVAEPSLIGRVIAAWPSFALIGAYEMLMCQVRQSPASVASSVRRGGGGWSRRRGWQANSGDYWRPDGVSGARSMIAWCWT